MYGQGNVSYNTSNAGSSSSTTLSGGDNGISISTIDPTKLVLGQDVSQPGDPAILLSDREVPMDGQFIEFSGSGSIYIDVDTPASAQSIVFFGDSITAGFNATTPSKRYTTLTAAGLGLTEVNNGLSGSTLENRAPVDPYGTANMVSRIPLIPAKTSALKWLVFLYGINDIQYNGANYTTANFQTDFQSVITAALGKGWPAASIVLLSTCYVDPTQFTSQFGNPPATNARQVAFNTVIQNLATANGCLFFDGYNAIFNNGAGRLMSGVHPLNSGHQYVAMGLINLLADVTQSGQRLAVNGPVELSALQLAGFGNSPQTSLPLSVDGAGNVGIAGTVNGVVISAFDKGLFGGAGLNDHAETVLNTGGYFGTSMRLNGPLQGTDNIGNSIEMATLSSTTCSINAFNRGTGSGTFLALGGYGSAKVTIGNIALAPALADLTIARLTDSLGALRVGGAAAWSGVSGAGIELTYSTGGAGTWGGIQVINRAGGPAFNNLGLATGGGNCIVGRDATTVNDNGAKFQVAGDITTNDPGLGVGKWLLGKVQTAAVALDATRYVEVKIDGTVIKLAIVT